MNKHEPKRHYQSSVEIRTWYNQSPNYQHLCLKYMSCHDVGKFTALFKWDSERLEAH